MEVLETVAEQSLPASNEPDPADYTAWNAWREAGGGKFEAEEVEVTPPAGAKEPTPELSQETAESQTAAESGTEEEAEQEEEQAEVQEEPAPGKPAKGIDKRFRKLTGKIAELESRLAELHQPDAEEEAETEVASVTETGTEAEEAVAPELEDFEDTDTETQWQQYSKAIRIFNKGEMAKAIATALAAQKQKLDLEHSTATAEANWSKAAERYDDYDVVVKNDEIQVSPAMVSVCKADMDAEMGTDVSYYLGQHPEEAKRIAAMTMANNDAEWQRARVRAGIELAKIAAKIAPPVKKAAPKPAQPGLKPPAPPPQPPKKVTKAPPPPPQLRGTAPTEKFDLMDDAAAAADPTRWMRERQKELAAQGKR